MTVAQHREMSAVGSVLFLTAFGTVSQILGFGYRVALSRMVGAEVMGLYQLLMPVYSVLLSLTAVGLTAAASNLTSQHLALGNGQSAAQVLRTCLRLLVLILFPVGGAAILGSDAISVYLLGDARTQLGLVLLVPCVALTGVENLHKHVFYGAGLVRPPAVTELLEQVVRAAAVLGLLICFLPQYPERAAGLIVAGMVVCEVFSALTLTILYHSRLGHLRHQGLGEPGLLRCRRILSIAIPVGANALLGNLMEAINTTLIPRKLVEGGMDRGAAVSELGVVCGMTLPMLSLPTVFLGAMSLVLVPRLARSAALGQHDRVRRQIDRALSAVSVLTLPAMGMMAILGPDLGTLLFGQEKVGEHLIPLAIAIALSCYQSTFGAVLNGIGCQGSVALISILCDMVQLAFTATLVARPGVGISGYVLGALAATALGLSLCAWRVVKATGLRLRLFQWATAPGLAALLMSLVTNLLYRVLRDSGLPLPHSLAVALPFGTVLYLAALNAQGVHLQEVFRFK